MHEHLLDRERKWREAKNTEQRGSERRRGTSLGLVPPQRIKQTKSKKEHEREVETDRGMDREQEEGRDGDEKCHFLRSRPSKTFMRDVFM